MSNEPAATERDGKGARAWVTLLTVGGLGAMVGVTAWMLLVPGSEQPSAPIGMENTPGTVSVRPGGASVAVPERPVPSDRPMPPATALPRAAANPSSAPPAPAPAAAAGVAARLPEPTAPPPESAPAEPPDPAQPAPPMVWSLDREGIRAAMRESTPQIKECYEGWLRANPGLEGRFTAQFTIGPSSRDPERGAVQEVGIRETQLNHPLLEGCILNVVSALQFERPAEGEVKVNYPFLFRSASEPEGSGND